MIKKVIWASMIDYPGKIATVLFVGKCNFNCGYCYNRTLVSEKDIDFDQQIFPKLLERKDFIPYVIISGGEPTVDKEFGSIVEKLYNNGFVIGVHTNGSNPEVINKYIDKIDFLGIDMKSSEGKYDYIAGVNVNFDKVKETIKIALDNKKGLEIRTTLFPKYVDIEDCIEIAETLKELGVKEYQLQQFYAVNGAEDVEAYSNDKLMKIQEECNKILPTVLKTK